MEQVAKTTIVDQVLNWAKFKADQQAKKTDGTKRNRYTICSLHNCNPHTNVAD